MDAAGTVEVRSDTSARARLKALIASSPWVTISVLLHVIAITTLAVIHVAGGRTSEPWNGTAPVIPRRARPVIEETATAPEPPDRDRLPVFENAQEAAFDPSREYVDEAPPGAPGESVPDQIDPTKQAGIETLFPDDLAALSGMPGGTSMGIGRIGHRSLGVSALATWREGGGGPGGGGLGENGKGGRPGRKPDPQTESTIAALRWLAHHQSEDGRWDCDGFDAQCEGERCSGRGEATYDVGVTGLALLCFLGAGYTHERPSMFRKTVREGLEFLMQAQDTDGIFGGRSCQHFQYNHACAALAMVEAYGMTASPRLKGPAERAVAWVLRSRNPYRAWRYEPADGDNDSSVTGWMAMVLKSAAMGGLPIEHAALDDAVSFIDEMTDPSSGRTGYRERGGLPARVQGDAMERFPAERSESLTAVGVLTRIFDGRKPASDPALERGARLLAAQPPKWDAPNIDFYYWYYGTLALFQYGGPEWEQWKKAMERELLAHQCADPAKHDVGSWDPVDPWSSEGGRVYSTALNCLCMEVYYRYPRVFGGAIAPSPAPR
jgi:hypothetical protein